MYQPQKIEILLFLLHDGNHVLDNVPFLDEMYPTLFPPCTFKVQRPLKVKVYYCVLYH